MYTRFKSQNSGIKLNLNTIASKNPRVIIPSSTKPDLNANAFKPTSISNSALITNASVIVDNDKLIISTDPTSPIDKNSTISILSDGFRVEKTEEKTSNSSKTKKPKKEAIVEESIDPICISYVKSMWEKYVSEIGTEEGPRRHVDENSQNHPHLNGFVAFDMEHWWAERSISCMINEKQETQSDRKTSSTIKDTQIEFPMNNCFSLKSFNSHSSFHRTLQSINSSQLCIC